MHCLIADDGPGAARIWRGAADRLGGTATVAVSVDEALAALETDLFDLIVVDLMMKAGGGKIVADLAVRECAGAPLVVMAEPRALGDGWPLALAPEGAVVVPKSRTVDEAVRLLATWFSRPARGSRGGGGTGRGAAGVGEPITTDLTPVPARRWRASATVTGPAGHAGAQAPAPRGATVDGRAVRGGSGEQARRRAVPGRPLPPG